MFGPADAAPMDAVSPIFTGLGLLAAAVYLFFCHSLSVIARKTDQGDTAEIFAYLPMLQVLPMIWAGGGRVWRALLVGVALVLADVLLFVAAGMVEGPLSVLMMFAATSSFAIACTLYFAVIGWNTAIARGLPGFVGLLTLVASALAYPILAFHDGWARPHRAGATIGAVLCLAFVIPMAFLGDEVERKLAEVQAEAAAEAGGTAFDPVAFQTAIDEAEPAPMPDTVAVVAEESAPGEAPAPMPTPVARSHEQSIRALFQLQERFDRLDAISTPDRLRDADDRARALALVGQLRAELAALRGQLDAATHAELASHLVAAEARIHGRPVPGDRAGRGQVRLADRAGPQPGASHAPPAAPAAPADPAPTRPFPVRIADECPPDTELRSRASDDGHEEWCQQRAEQGGLRHGWYARLLGDGRPEQVGEYREGLRVGVWTRFHPDGSIRAQAQFEEGMQHGWLLSFDRAGARQKALRFDRGNPVR